MDCIFVTHNIISNCLYALHFCDMFLKNRVMTKQLKNLNKLLKHMKYYQMINNVNYMIHMAMLESIQIQDLVNKVVVVTLLVVLVVQVQVDLILVMDHFIFILLVEDLVVVHKSILKNYLMHFSVVVVDVVDDLVVQDVVVIYKCI